MKKLSAGILFLSISTLSVAQQKKASSTTAKKPVAAETPAMKNGIDSLSYAMGVQVASYYKSQGIDQVNINMLAKAYDDVFNNKPLNLSAEMSNLTIQQKLQEFASKKAQQEKIVGAQFLAENKKKAGVIELPSGLQYQVITMGNGEKPVDGQTVKVHYHGTLIDGTVFDSSVERGQPLDLNVNGVIAGWTEALKMMPVGSKWKLFIPSNLAYGDRGAGGKIKPGSTLIFDVELISIVK